MQLEHSLSECKLTQPPRNQLNIQIKLQPLGTLEEILTPSLKNIYQSRH